MNKAHKVLRFLTMLFLLAAVLSGLFGAPRLMVGIIYVLTPVAVAYIALAIVRFMYAHREPKPVPMPDPYWPPSRRRGGVRIRD